MLAWYRSQLREHGTIQATQLLCRVVLRRSATTLINRLLPQRVMCPCCGWEGRRFHDYLEIGLTSPNVECPQCNSHPRHRALALWLQHDYKIQERHGTALIFAPERALENTWQQASHLHQIKVDITASRGVNALADVQQLPFATDTIDLIWCHHVLQLVRDDRAALRELHRTLRPRTGELILSVAIAHGTKTEEYRKPKKELLDFWRMYGDDFALRLREAGFFVREVGYQLSAEEYRRYRIDPQENFYLCTKAETTPNNPTLL